MYRFSALVFLLSLPALQACSNQRVYEAIQYNQRLQCNEVPPAEYTSCLERNNHSFQEYKQARDESLGK